MTTEQQQTNEPQELAERLARLEGVISDIPRQLDAQNRVMEGLRAEVHAGDESLRAEMHTGDESLRTEIRALSAKVDRLANAVLIGSIALSVSLVGGLVAIFVAILTRT